VFAVLSAIVLMLKEDNFICGCWRQHHSNEWYCLLHRPWSIMTHDVGLVTTSDVL
jgi:hypothetical protein